MTMVHQKLQIYRGGETTGLGGLRSIQPFGHNKHGPKIRGGAPPPFC